MTSLKSTLSKLTLNNPTILASGVLDCTGPLLKRVAEAGAGAVTTKSISLKPIEGHPTPSIVEIKDGLLNAMGLPNPGVDEFLDELKIAKVAGVPIIASIAGKSINEFKEVAKRFVNLPDALELNLSCPNVKGGLLFSQDKKLAASVVKDVKKVTKLPVFAKLGPNVSNIAEIARAVEKAGADGITAINTMPAMVIDIETGMPILSNKSGGLSGTALKPIAIKCVYDIYESVKIPIIGTGGVSNGADAVEMLMAGASAVGIGTAIKKHWLSTFSKINKELDAFMKRKKFKSTKELVGLAHKV